MAERSLPFKQTSVPKVVSPSSTTNARRSSTRLVWVILLPSSEARSSALSRVLPSRVFGMNAQHHLQPILEPSPRTE